MGRPGDGGPDDGFGGESEAFLAELDAASKAGAAREYAMVLEFVQKQRPGLTAIDASSASTGTSNIAGPHSISIRSRCGRTSLTSACNKAFSTRRRNYFTWSFVRRRWMARTRGPLGQFCDGMGCYDGPAEAAGGSGIQTQKIGRFYLDMHPRDGKDKWSRAFHWYRELRACRFRKRR